MLELTAVLKEINSQYSSLKDQQLLVCLFNTQITRMSDKVFCSYLQCEETSYKTFFAKMFELSLIVEAKIQAEMKGKGGTILHDGWSKYSLHYIAVRNKVDPLTNNMSGNNVCLPTADSVIAIPDGPGSLLLSSVNLSIKG